MYLLCFSCSPSHPNQLKIGINGFNSIGQIVFKCALAQGVQVVGVNKYFFRCQINFQLLQIHVFTLITRLINLTMIQHMENSNVKMENSFSTNNKSPFIPSKYLMKRKTFLISSYLIFFRREPLKIPWNQFGMLFFSLS